MPVAFGTCWVILLPLTNAVLMYSLVGPFIGSYLVSAGTVLVLIGAWLLPRNPTTAAQNKPAAHRATHCLVGRLDAAYLVVFTIGMLEDNCRLISKSMRRSIWNHNAVFLGEITFSKSGTYFMRSAISCSSMAFDRVM